MASPWPPPAPGSDGETMVRSYTRTVDGREVTVRSHERSVVRKEQTKEAVWWAAGGAATLVGLTFQVAGLALAIVVAVLEILVAWLVSVNARQTHRRPPPRRAPRLVPKPNPRSRRR